MRTNCLVLGLSLCLVLSSFHEVSCQDDGTSGMSTLDLIEREYQDSVNGLKDGEDQSAKVQSKNQNTTVTDNNTISLSLSNESDGTFIDESAKRSSLLDQIELEFEAHLNGLNQAGSAGFKSETKDDEELSAKRLSMLEEIEREFEAATESLKQLHIDDSTGDKEQIAKRQSLLEEIERDFEAATSGLKELNEGNADDEQSAKRKSLLEEIEREFEEATKGLEQLKVSDFTEDSVNEEQSAKRKSMLEEIEREFEASIEGLKQIKTDDSRNIEEQSAKRKIMLEEIEREFEEAQSGFIAKVNKEDSTKKQSSSKIGQSGDCGCFNQDKDSSIVIPTKFSIEEVLSEESAVQGTETFSLSASLSQLFESHRKEKESHISTSSSSSSTSESAASSDTVESLSAKLKELRGLTARELVTRKDFEKILITAARFEELSSAPISYISRLAKYSNVIKQGLGASERVNIAKARAKMLKETASEKQNVVDDHFANAKTLAQRGDALYVRIFAIKKLLTKLEAEKESVDGKFKEIMKNLTDLLGDASEAYEEYHEAVTKAKDEEAADEFAREATKSAEIIWVKFLSSV